jgi:isoleucyl-tRNA synthetase
VLVELSKLIAPFVPYLAEELYTSLTGEESVHLVEYPESDSRYIDSTLESDMQKVIDVVSLGRTARGECQIKIRQPLGEMYVPAKLLETISRMLPLVQEEVNIHHIRFVAEDSDFVQYDLKPQFKAMGPKYGKQMKAIATKLESVNGADALRAFAKEGKFSFDLEGQEVELVPEDIAVQIRPREGYVFASMKDIYVALETTLTPELLSEGYARELVNKIQFARKEQGFEIMDRICVEYLADEEISKAIAQYQEFIMNETLADSIQQSTESNLTELDINGKAVGLKVYLADGR